MRRRDIVAGLLVAAAFGRAHAQPTAKKIPRIGYLGTCPNLNRGGFAAFASHGSGSTPSDSAIIPNYILVEVGQND